MKVNGSCTLYHEVDIDPVEVIRAIKTNYISSLGIENLDSKNAYLDCDNIWSVDLEGNHCDPIAVTYRKATTEEINMMNSFNTLFELAKKM